MFLCVMLCVMTPLLLLIPLWYLMVSDGPDCIADKHEYQRKGKYVSIKATHLYVPIGIDTTGVWLTIFSMN